MAFAPTALTAAQYPIAQVPTMGGEMKVELSNLAALEMGQFLIEATNSGTWTGDPVNTTLATPCDLLLMLSSPLNGGASNVVVTVTGTDQNDAALTGTATIKPIAWAQNTSRVFPISYAVDVVPGTANKLFKTVSAVTLTCASDAATTTFKLIAMPVNTSFKLVGCTTDKDFTTKARPAKPIACGMDGSAFVGLGRSEPGTLNIKSKAITFGDGLMRYNGINCTARCTVVKQGQVTTEKLYFIGYNTIVKPSYGDGEAEAMFDGSGFYTDLAMMVAAGAT